MPVILPAAAHNIWLRAGTDEAEPLVKAYPADRLAIQHTTDLWVQR